MTAYVITTKNTITRQEGDYPAVIPIIVPESLSLTGVTEVKFNVYDAEDTLIFSRTYTDSGGVTISDQTISVALIADNTLGYSGRQKWECEITKTGEVITIGEGVFIIKKQLITNT
jgi:hypothetical protein